MPARRSGLVATAVLLAHIAGTCHAQGYGQAPDPELRQALTEAAADEPGLGDRFAAEVWLLDMSGRLSRFMPDASERLAFLRAVHREASRASLQPELVLAVIEVESRFDRFALSR